MLRSLSEAERAVLNRQQNGLPRDHRSGAPPTTVFGFASSFDKYVLYGSALGALIAGATNPLISVRLIPIRQEQLLLTSYTGYLRSTSWKSQCIRRWNSIQNRALRYYLTLHDVLRLRSLQHLPLHLCVDGRVLLFRRANSTHFTLRLP